MSNQCTQPEDVEQVSEESEDEVFVTSLSKLHPISALDTAVSSRIIRPSHLTCSEEQPQKDAGSLLSRNLPLVTRHIRCYVEISALFDVQERSWS